MEEQTLRGIGTGESPFLNWCISEQGHLIQSSPNRGTACAVVEAFQACKREHIQFHIEDNRSVTINILISNSQTEACNTNDARTEHAIHSSKTVTKKGSLTA